MFLNEPPPTQGDIHFRLGDTPVRIHPYFWIMTVLLGLNGKTPPAALLAWVVAVVVSILVHEFGHAVWQRRYGGHPRITLYGMGGMAACDDCDRSPRAQIEISLAGPVAGFLLAVLVIACVRTVGHQIGVQTSEKIDFASLGVESVIPLRMLGLTFYWEPFAADIVNFLLGGLIQINILWGLVNLLPIYPLDGGRISREVCQLSHPQRGILLSLKISMICAAAMVLVGLSWGSIFVAVFFGYLSYSSYRTLQAYQASIW